MISGESIIQLDTNCLIALSNASSSTGAALLKWLADGGSLQVSIMAWAEFQCGGPGGLRLEEDAAARTAIDVVLSPTETEAELAARLFNATGRRSRSLADCLIAACAMQADVLLVTENRDDFQPFLEHGLRLAELESLISGFLRPEIGDQPTSPPL